jgi:hypothetical protein
LALIEFAASSDERIWIIVTFAGQKWRAGKRLIEFCSTAAKIFIECLPLVSIDASRRKIDKRAYSSSICVNERMIAQWAQVD